MDELDIEFKSRLVDDVLDGSYEPFVAGKRVMEKGIGPDLGDPIRSISRPMIPPFPLLTAWNGYLRW